ncbi:group IIE secretory phospholipase A2 isoform X2 [Pogona vitticeps]
MATVPPTTSGLRRRNDLLRRSRWSPPLHFRKKPRPPHPTTFDDVQKKVYPRYEGISPGSYPGGKRCCFNHDCCYERLHQRKCHPYIDHYRYLIINGDVLCNYRNKSICSMLACECDEQAAYCFSQEAKSYNRKWRHYPGILCKEPTPKCPEEKNEQGNGSSSTNQSHQQESGGSQTRTNPAVILQLK